MDNPAQRRRIGWTGGVLIRSADLGRLGLSRAEMQARVRRGEARLVRPGAWTLAPSTSPEADHRQLVASTFPGLRDGAVISHASAAALHGLPIPRGELERTHVTRPGRSGKRTQFLHIHRGEVAEDDLVTVDGFATTGLVRTVLDCARLLAPADGLALVDAALARGLDREVCLERLAAEGPRRGSARARAVVRHGDPRSESPGESWSRWQMIELGIPLPRLQVTLVDDHGADVARTDFLWDDIGLVGEFDGGVKYGRLLKPGQDVSDVVLAEKAREERIRRQGYWIVRWTAAELFPAARFRTLMLDAWKTAPRAA